MEPVYNYRRTGRHFENWTGLGASIVAIAMVEQFDFDNTILAIVFRVAPWAGLAVAIWALVRNPVYGIDLTDTTLTISPVRNPQVIALKDIESLSIIPSEGTYSYVLHLKIGEKINISPKNLPSHRETRDAFEARGVAVDGIHSVTWGNFHWSDMRP